MRLRRIWSRDAVGSSAATVDVSALFSVSRHSGQFRAVIEQTRCGGGASAATVDVFLFREVFDVLTL